MTDLGRGISDPEVGLSLPHGDAVNNFLLFGVLVVSGEYVGMGKVGLLVQPVEKRFKINILDMIEREPRTGMRSLFVMPAISFAGEARTIMMRLSTIV